MIITLFSISNEPLYCQFEISILTISVGEKQRSLFSVWKDGSKIEIDILYLRILNQPK